MNRRILPQILTVMMSLGGGLVYADATTDRPFYHLESTIVLQSQSPDWDYLTLDEPGSRLFIARRSDGAAVVDVKENRLIGTIDRSDSANAIVLAPTRNRGFTINEDGSTTIFELSSLKTLNRVSFGDSADTATFDAATNQLVVMMGDSKAIVFLDPDTGALIDTIDMQTNKMEAPTPDGTGMIFTALRNKDAIAKIDAGEHVVIAVWTIDGCRQPSGMALDTRNQRLFVGCRGYGQHPVLAVIDSNSGRLVTTLEIGRGNDGVIYDDESRKIFTSNGVDSNLVIYDQLDADSYELSEVATTRPYARTMAMDHRNKKLYLVTAEGTVDPSRKQNKGPANFYPNRYFADTFVVLTYSSR